MYPQTTSRATVIDRGQSTAVHKPVPRLSKLEKPALYVVGCAEPPCEIGIDAAERERQASLEFLHRLVMG